MFKPYMASNSILCNMSVLNKLKPGAVLLPVTRVVNGCCDALGVVRGETEAVVLLEVLIGSHADRGQKIIT